MKRMMTITRPANAFHGITNYVQCYQLLQSIILMRGCEQNEWVGGSREYIVVSSFRAACSQITLKLSYWRVRGLRDGEHFDEGSNVYIITFVIYG